MHYAVCLAPFGEASDPRLLSRLAREAEAAGWDGFFLWDHMNWSMTTGLADPWISLAACAMTTERIRLGTLVTPVFRRRPTQLARETATLQNLSGGRLVLGVGLGSPDPEEALYLGEEARYPERARMTDEALALLKTLWAGGPVTFRGEFYRVQTEGFQPVPCAPIPIWVAATWPFKRGPLRRAAACDGVVPALFEDRFLRPADVAPAATAVPGDVAFGRPTRPGDGHVVADYAAVGVTWWLEPLNPWFYATFPDQYERLVQGPPR